MRFRIISLFLLISICTSCDFFNLKKKSQLQQLDTIIDFNSVDVSPSFAVCDSIFEKAAKDKCFRITIHKHISESLSKHKLEVRKAINETIQLVVVIDNKGNTIANQIAVSDSLKITIPVIDSLIRVSVQNLPKLFPATKRGIPVATQYQIPIQIVVNKK